MSAGSLRKEFFFNATEWLEFAISLHSFEIGSYVSLYKINKVERRTLSLKFNRHLLPILRIDNSFCLKTFH